MSIFFLASRGLPRGAEAGALDTVPSSIRPIGAFLVFRRAGRHRRPRQLLSSWIFLSLVSRRRRRHTVRMDAVNEWLLTCGDNLWTWIVLPIVVLLGLYFTIRSGVVQFRLIPEMFRTLKDRTPRTETGEPQSVSSFQAFTISAASRVGVGNIAGVGTAIAIGGPGAVFWMWLMAFIGGASAFIESSLAQLYKRRDRDGFIGGPAYYMQRGLGARWMGVLFAVILIICFPIAFSSLQANTIQATIAGSLGGESAAWLPWVTGGALALLMGLVIFGACAASPPSPRRWSRSWHCCICFSAW